VNFNQWKTFVAKGNVPKITYCCGDQSVLVESVVEDIKTTLQVPDTDLIELDARTTNSVWDKASQFPLNPDANRLIVVRNSESVSNWTELSKWLTQTKNNTANYIVFVSHQSDAPAIVVKGKRTSYQEHIEIIRTKGKFVRCSQPNDEDLVNWGKSYGLTKAVAEHLVERTSGDTRAMLDVLKKVHVWQGSPSEKAVDLLCEEQALDDFSDYLVLRQKNLAMLSLQSMSDEDKSKIISRLDYKLDTIMEINRCVRKRMYSTDIAATTGIKIFLVKKFIPVSKEYDEPKIKYCRKLLAMIDSSLNSGAKVGVWEVLISLW